MKKKKKFRDWFPCPIDYRVFGAGAEAMSESNYAIWDSLFGDNEDEEE